MNAIDATLNAQRLFFYRDETRPLAFRQQQLTQLKQLLIQHQAAIIEALQLDLGKPNAESIISEWLFVQREIEQTIRDLPQWMRKRKVKTPLTSWPGRSLILPEPLGTVFIIGPWNYPFMLIMSPLIGAIAAGNCVVLKPSEIATHTQKLICHLINDHFPANYLYALKAGPVETAAWLEHRFDHVFFTGSPAVGKIIMQAAAKQLTPITLELGGKSPCIVDETANLDFAAKRIIWAKMLNAGQTCVAPDFILVHESQYQPLIHCLTAAIQQFFGENPALSADFGRIINEKHMDRLTQLCLQADVIVGGQLDKASRYIAPTLIGNVNWHDALMQTEIFGPLLPLVTFKELEEVITHLRTREKPLALYIFSQNTQAQRRLIQSLSFGGGCINDCLMHIANRHLPFGGVGQSGMGRYHGQFSFETFSHAKSIYQKFFSFDLKLEYPPYTQQKLAWIKRLFN